jgi:hypothetical protein
MAWTRTFGWSERFYGMTDTAITAKKTVEVGKSKFLTSAPALRMWATTIARQRPRRRPVSGGLRRFASHAAALSKGRLSSISRLMHCTVPLPTPHSAASVSCLSTRTDDVFVRLILFIFACQLGRQFLHCGIGVLQVGPDTVITRLSTDWGL